LTGTTLQSGVSFPIEPSPILERYLESSFWGTLQPHPLRIANFNREKLLSKPILVGSNLLYFFFIT